MNQKFEFVENFQCGSTGREKRTPLTVEKRRQTCAFAISNLCTRILMRCQTKKPYFNINLRNSGRQCRHFVLTLAGLTSFLAENLINWPDQPLPNFLASHFQN